MNEEFFVYNIDVIEGCNLRCPSCPVGNSRDAERPRGRMSPKLLAIILDKAKKETPNMEVGLFSWTEPLLHPQLPELIRIVKRHNIACRLSSNLNRIDNIEEVILAQPDSLRISLSGFFQETYGQTHRAGDIEVVKANMHTLHDIIQRLQSKTRVTVGYHRYRHNMGDDFKQMTALAEKLSFIMEPVWAYLMPLEKILAYHENLLPPTDHKIIELLAISPDEQKKVQAGTPDCDCYLRSNQMTINADGSVALCCGVFDKRFNIAPQFTDVGFEELQQRKYLHEMCVKCMSHDIHKTAVMDNSDVLDQIGYANIGQPLKSWCSGLRKTAKAIRRRAAMGTRVRRFLNRRHERVS